MSRLIIAALLSLALAVPARAHTPPPARQVGYAAHYRPGAMERVVRKRGLPPGHRYVASPYHPVGTRLTVCRRDQCVPVVVADVCHPRDCATIRRRGIVVELSFPLARQLCGIRRYGQEPPRACPVIVYRGW